MKKLLWFLLIAAISIGGIFFYYRGNINGALAPIRTPELEEGTNVRENRQERQSAEHDFNNQTRFPLSGPKNFNLSIFSQELGDPRDLTLDPKGRVVVSVPDRGAVYVLLDDNGDGKEDRKAVVVGGLRLPHGLLFHCKEEKCQLFIAEEDKVEVFDYDTDAMRASNGRKIADLPSGGRHTTRSLELLEEEGSEKLLISVGSSCDVCIENSGFRAAVLEANLDGSGLKIFAGGLRNSVFMTKNPISGKIWATEMGRDFLGNDLPPDEINILERGKFYGWPYCFGNRVRDNNFQPGTTSDSRCANSTPSHLNIQAHSAPLGLAFVPEEGWPDDMQGDLLVAYHGSWNRTVPTGYKVVKFDLDENGNLKGSGADDFIAGWLGTRASSFGRPVDILALPGGVAYISDDKAGMIYRLTYDGPLGSANSDNSAADNSIKDCAVGGCSSQICGEAGDDLVSTCEYRDEYACYRNAECKRQQDGRCGWTKTQELVDCIGKNSRINTGGGINDSGATIIGN